MSTITEIVCPICAGRGNVPYIKRIRSNQGPIIARAKACEPCDGTGTIKLTPDAVVALINRLVDTRASYKP